MRRSGRLSILMIFAFVASLAVAPTAFGVEFGVAKPKWRSPSITTVVTAPGPGVLSQNGAISNSEGRTIQVCITSADAAAEGPITLTCKVDRSTLKALRRKSVRITLTTIFAAPDGSSAYKVQKITLPRRR